jgi:hypothetical protein
MVVPKEGLPQVKGEEYGQLLERKEAGRMWRRLRVEISGQVALPAFD